MKGRVLVAPDRQIDCQPLLQQLAALGFEFTVAGDGHSLLEFAQSQAFDLALMGINQPDINGYLLLERLKANPALVHLPVIVISAVHDLDAVARCIELGAEDYLPAPFNPVLLKARLRACLEKKHLYDQERESIRKTEKLANDLQHVILPLGIALSAEKNFARLLERVVWEAKSICNADAGTLYLVTPDNRLEFAIMFTDSLHIALGGADGKKVPFAPLPLYDKKTGEPNFTHVSTYVALEGKSANIPDIYQTRDFDFSATKEFDRKNAYRSISCLTVPLKNYDNAVIGVLQLLNAQDSKSGKIIAFEAYQQLVVESLASQAAVALSNYMLMQRQKELLKFEHDMQVGRKIQEGFLPNDLPHLPGWDIEADFQPARQVSGDFYDVFALSRDKVGLVIADVADKGVPAALFMALVRSLIRAFAQEQYSYHWMNFLSAPASTYISPPRPSAQIESDSTLKNAVMLTNNYIVYNHSQLNMFATLFFGVLDPASGTLSYINCGHNAPVLFNPSGIKARLNATGPVVGVLADAPLEMAETHLDAGDFLLMFTDGVTDVRSINGQFFGEERLLNLLSAAAYPDTQTLLSKIRDCIGEHRGDADQFDDITMLALHRI
ncbi:MAG: SpoIIE family protein phosphatase [Chloroflexi bacterium]|nr:SpoIIE family protein phosphatase [Chloroflexota bacterium]